MSDIEKEIEEEIDEVEESEVEDDEAEFVDDVSPSGISDDELEQGQAAKKKPSRFSKRKTKKKRKNSYFVPFGIKQLCDLLMIFGGLLVFAGLFVHRFADNDIPLLIGLSMYIVACVLTIVRTVRIIIKNRFTRADGQFKRAIINLVIIVVLLAVAVLAVVAMFVWR